MEAVRQALELPILSRHGVTLAVKREDLLFPLLSGNKFRKLKYNLKYAREEGFKTLLTFGGAFSNHLHATAAAGRHYGLKTIGLVRGEELAEKPLNPTLAAVRKNGMQLEFLSRQTYRRKSEQAFLDTLRERFGPVFILPEGGTNQRAVRGCEEILGEGDRGFSHIWCPVGTGGTLAGLARSAWPDQQLLGYPAIRAGSLESQLHAWIPGDHWNIIGGYHFGGYGKVTAELIEFINDFKGATGIALDPVYTGKMMYGILEGIRRKDIPEGSRVLAIHTGGLQGIAGMNMRLKKKNLPLLHL
ncbi:MAG: pyridoxal-phosphate dependent enzyme [Robiginitalea sp.]